MIPIQEIYILYITLYYRGLLRVVMLSKILFTIVYTYHMDCITSVWGIYFLFLQGAYYNTLEVWINHWLILCYCTPWSLVTWKLCELIFWGYWCSGISPIKILQLGTFLISWWFNSNFPCLMVLTLSGSLYILHVSGCIFVCD